MDMDNAPPPGDDERVCFELVLRPSVVLTTLVRRFITDFYDRVLSDEDSTSRLALATQELLENAIKYGVEGDTVLSVELDRRAGVVRVRTSNRSHPKHIAVLQRRFEEMREAPDAFKFYQQLLRSTMHDTVGSGLGLARIRCEGEMDIDVTVDGDMVGVSAVARTSPLGSFGSPSRGIPEIVS